jgi:hypothetical protein
MGEHRHRKQGDLRRLLTETGAGDSHKLLEIQRQVDKQKDAVTESRLISWIFFYFFTKKECS